MSKWRKALLAARNSHVLMGNFANSQTQAKENEFGNRLDHLEDIGYRIVFDKKKNDQLQYYHFKAIKKGISIRFSVQSNEYYVHFFVMSDTGGYVKLPDQPWRNGGKTPSFAEMLKRTEDYKVPETIRDIQQDYEFKKSVIMRRTYGAGPVVEFFYADMLYRVDVKGIYGVDGTKVNTEAVAIKDNDVWFLLYGVGRCGSVQILSDGIKYRYVKTSYNYKTKIYSATLTRNNRGEMTTNDQRLIECAIEYYIKTMREKQEEVNKA